MLCNLGPPSPAYGPFIYGDSHRRSQFPVADWTERVDLEQIVCPEFPGHQRGGERIGDLEIVLPSPDVGDFVWTWGSECIIADKVLALFRNALLTGFDVRPVTVGRIEYVPQGRQVQMPGLWELIVKGRGGDAAPESGIRLIYECGACGMKRYSSFRRGIIVDEKQWDGSDFFTVNGYPRFILVADRVVELVIANELTNCALIPADKLLWASLSRPEDIAYE